MVSKAKISGNTIILPINPFFYYNILKDLKNLHK